MQSQTCDVKADDFITFDKAPLVRVVNIKYWKFTVRETTLAFVAIVLLILCLVFLGLYDSKKSDSIGASFQQNEFCESRECMKTAMRATELMNTSVDPCDDFYEYACGNYKFYNPHTRKVQLSVRDDMNDLNKERLFGIIQRPPTRLTELSYERKISHFYQACTDTYKREKLLGRPFLKNVVEALGGWALLGTWNKESWDLNTALKKVQTDFWAPAFYETSVYVPGHVTLTNGGLSRWMKWARYTSQEHGDNYKKFIRRVGSLLMRDANLVDVSSTLREFRLEQFVNDTFTIESKIDDLISMYTGPGFSWGRRESTFYPVSLSALNTETNNVIDWVDQLSYLFNESNVNASTKVIVWHMDYFLNVTSMISDLPAASRKRMLHHYLIWRVAERYAQDLSGEYVHAGRVMSEDRHGYPNLPDLSGHCLWLVQYYMKDALGAIYVNDHFATKSKEKVADITMNLKKALKSRLDKTSWMDKKTKKKAKAKLDKVTFRIGYPDWLTNNTRVDNIYTDLKVNASDYFGLLLSANVFEKKAWNKRFRVGYTQAEAIYEPDIGYNYWQNTITATAGLLQDPIFNRNAPHFSTFGSLGTILAQYLHRVTGKFGIYYDKDGNRIKPGSWWSNYTAESHRPIMKCMEDIYRNITMDRMLALKLSQMEGDYYLNHRLRYYASTTVTLTNSIRVALEGYRLWVDGHTVKEGMLPGLLMTPDKMIFLSFVQANCDTSHMFLLVGRKTRINTALGQLTEFSTAFQCKAGTKMNHEKKCDS